MSATGTHLYKFGPFRIDPVKRLLLKGEEIVPLTPKAFDTLMVLVESSGHLVDKDELMQRVWPDAFVEEAGLTRNISVLRKVLGESPNDHRFIVTVPGRGYRFVADVKEVLDENANLIVRERTRTSITIKEEETNGEAGEPAFEQNAINASSTWAVTDTEPKSRDFAPQEASTAEQSINKIKRRTLIALTAIIIAAAAIAFGLYRLTGHNDPTKPYDPSSITRLTTTGNAVIAAVSPDSKEVVYVISEAGRQSLWLRQIGASGNVQIVSPAQGVRYLGLTFSHDGDHIYYVRQEGDNPSTLYQMSRLGATPRKLIENVGNSVTLSPDGKQVAFVRALPDQQESILMVADIDGTGERRLATRRAPEDFSSFPAWSPDGKTITCGAGGRFGDCQWTVVEVQVESGATKRICSRGWYYGRWVAWLPDGSGLVVSTLEQGGAPHQLWYISYPGGEARRITNDFIDYQSVSLTTDSRALVTVHSERVSHIWVAPDGDADRARQITFGTSHNNTPYWAPDGRVVYTSNASGNWDIWIMDADGSNQKQLTFDPAGDGHLTVTPDGRSILFMSERAGSSNIWRMDLDGGNQRQITRGRAESTSHCSPDGKWIVYTSGSSPTPTTLMLWKAPIDGGDPIRLSDKFALDAAISPDGRFMACAYRGDQPGSPRKIAVVPFEGGPPVKIFDVTPSGFSRVWWTADGRAITYVDTRDGVSNIWAQPLDGSPPRRLTDFKSDQISNFNWSRDGRLVFSRVSVTSDVVLISNFR